jgi:hypothetical protein
MFLKSAIKASMFKSHLKKMVYPHQKKTHYYFLKSNNVAVKTPRSLFLKITSQLPL